MLLWVIVECRRYRFWPLFTPTCPHPETPKTQLNFGGRGVRKLCRLGGFSNLFFGLRKVRKFLMNSKNSFDWLVKSCGLWVYPNNQQWSQNALSSGNTTEEQLKWTSKSKKSILRAVRLGSALSLRRCPDAPRFCWRPLSDSFYNWYFFVWRLILAAHFASATKRQHLVFPFIMCWLS